MTHGVKQRRRTDRMQYLDTPIIFRAHGKDCLALVLDEGRAFARWFEGETIHLAWVQTSVFRSVTAPTKN